MLIKIICLSMVAFCAYAQNFSVVLWSTQPTNAQERIDGIPTNWPVSTLTHPIGTNTSVTPPAILMTKAEFLSLIASNQAAFADYESNKLAAAQAAATSKLDNVKALAEKIPVGITTLQKYSDEWERGTNYNAAQLQVWAQKNNEVTLGLLKLLREIKPALVEMYRGE